MRVSMDGRGRWMDNVFVERLWRRVKYEDIYLHDYATPRALQAGLASLLPVLQRGAFPFVPGLPHADGGVLGGVIDGDVQIVLNFARKKWENQLVLIAGGVLPRPRETWEGSRGPPAPST